MKRGLPQQLPVVSKSIFYEDVIIRKDGFGGILIVHGDQLGKGPGHPLPELVRGSESKVGPDRLLPLRNRGSRVEPPILDIEVIVLEGVGGNFPLAPAYHHTPQGAVYGLADAMEAKNVPHSIALPQAVR